MAARGAAIPTLLCSVAHCDFTAEERTQAFDDLVAWLERGIKPDGEDVLTADLPQVGLRWTKPLHTEDPAARR